MDVQDQTPQVGKDHELGQGGGTGSGSLVDVMVTAGVESSLMSRDIAFSFVDHKEGIDLCPRS